MMLCYMAGKKSRRKTNDSGNIGTDVPKAYEFLWFDGPQLPTSVTEITVQENLTNMLETSVDDIEEHASEGTSSEPETGNNHCIQLFIKLFLLFE